MEYDFTVTGRIVCGDCESKDDRIESLEKQRAILAAELVEVDRDYCVEFLHPERWKDADDCIKLVEEKARAEQ